MNRIIAIDPDAVHKYIPKIARACPEEDQPVFLIKSLKAKEAARLQDGIATVKSETMSIKSGTALLSALISGLVGWKNFKNAQGDDVLWRDNNGVAKSENFDLIPAEIRRELADVITEGTFLTEQEEKNSE